MEKPKSSPFYDGTKLLSMKDIKGQTPEIFMCTTNRSGGKTTWFNRYVLKKFITKREKFALFYRFKYELDDVADKFFKDIGSLFFPDYTMSSQRKSDGIYHELILTKVGDEEGVCCGYAIALNSADAIKKMSHFFSDVHRIVMDEFQSETNHYCPDEVRKFRSVHTSIARGQGKMSRYVPVFMIANPITLLNPYYVALDITTRLNAKTKFLKGEGFVVEQGYVRSAFDAQRESAFNRAFASGTPKGKDEYGAEGVYLNDNLSFIEKPTGRSKYICTVMYNGTPFAIREFRGEGIIYCDNTPDMTDPNRLALTTADHDINYVMLRANDLFIQNMRWMFEKGCFRFKDLRCKEVILRMLSY